MGLFTRSRNKNLYQSMENWFLGEKLIALGKYFCWGKFAEEKKPIFGVNFLVKKKEKKKPAIYSYHVMMKARMIVLLTFYLICQF